MFTGLLQDAIKDVYECPGEELSPGRGQQLCPHEAGVRPPSMWMCPQQGSSPTALLLGLLGRLPHVGVTDIHPVSSPSPFLEGGGGAENPKLLILGQAFW